MTVLSNARKADLDNLTKAYELQQKISLAAADFSLDIIGQQQDIAFAGSQQGKSPFEKQMAEIKESARKASLEAGRAFAAAFEDTGDGMTPEKAKEFADGLAAIADGYKSIADAQIGNLEAARTWEAGWSEAFAAYKDSAQNAAEQSKTYFDTFTKGMEDAMVKFVQTGKLNFKDLANSLIAEFVRIETKKAMVGLFSGSGGGLLSGIGKIFGFADGGNPPVGVPSIVGERGPELFVPRNAGTIIPNHALGGNTNNTAVTYNIQAVDAQSFQQMVARDPAFLYAVTEKGRKTMPFNGGRR
jgi:lambda family phage tail tape measure protein